MGGCWRMTRSFTQICKKCKGIGHGFPSCKAKDSLQKHPQQPAEIDQQPKTKPEWLELFTSHIPSTPIDIDKLEFELLYHPDRNFVSYLYNGLQFGFDTLIPRVNLVYKECKRLLNARQNPEDVQQLIESECQKGYLYGPFNEPPFHNNFRVSPIGLAVGKYSGKKRLIVDLSSPH